MKSSLIFLLAFLFNLALSADECLIRFTKRWGAEYYTIFSAPIILPAEPTAKQEKLLSGVPLSKRS